MSEYEKLHQRIAQLVERNEQLGAELECALGDVATAKEIIANLQKDADRYRSLRKITPYRFKKIQDASVTDGGDVFYFHADRFDSAIDYFLAKERT